MLTWTWRSLTKSEVKVLHTKMCVLLRSRFIRVINHESLLSLCLLILVWIVYLLLLGQLSPKHKRSSKQVNDGMFLPLVSSYLHDCDASFISHDEGLILSFTSRHSIFYTL